MGDRERAPSPWPRSVEPVSGIDNGKKMLSSSGAALSLAVEEILSDPSLAVAFGQIDSADDILYHVVHLGLAAGRLEAEIGAQMHDVAAARRHTPEHRISMLALVNKILRLHHLISESAAIAESIRVDTFRIAKANHRRRDDEPEAE